LSTNDEQHNRARERHYRAERSGVYQQMRGLATPATPDQVEQRTTLVSHLTIITDMIKLLL
jgi:hypothetical protein